MIREAIINAMTIRDVRAKELAEYIGIGKSSMSNYLSGRDKISLEKIEKAMRYLHMRISVEEKKEQP